MKTHLSDMLDTLARRLADTLAPRGCAVCGCRLCLQEQAVCSACNISIPRTHYARNPFDNDMAKVFWHLAPTSVMPWGASSDRNSLPMDSSTTLMSLCRYRLPPSVNGNGDTTKAWPSLREWHARRMWMLTEEASDALLLPNHKRC